MTEQTTNESAVIQQAPEEDDEPLWLEFVSVGVKLFILFWSISMLTLSYVRLPESIKIGERIQFNIPEQIGIDPTFPASLLGGILTSFGVNMGSKKKKNGDANNNTGGQQTIVLKQPIEIITKPPIASKE